MRSTTRFLTTGSLLYPALSLIAFIAFPQPPGGDVSPEHDPTWLAAHTGAVIAQAYLRSVAAIGFALLAVALSIGVRAVLARLIIVGGVGMSFLLITAQALVLGGALGVRGGADPSVTRGVDNLHAGVLDLSSLPTVVMFAAAAIALRNAPHLPRWFVILTAVGAPLALLDAISYDGGPLAELGAIGLAFFLVWSIVAAAVLVRSAPVRSERDGGAIVDVPVRAEKG